MKAVIPLTACTVTEVTIRQVPQGKQVQVSVRLEGSASEWFAFSGAGDLDEIGTLVEAEFISVSTEHESSLSSVGFCWAG